MKVCQVSSTGPRQTQPSCRHCSKVFANCGSFARHQLRDHQDTWAVIDMMEAGMSDREAGDLYDRSIKQGVKNFGSYYSRTKRNIKREKIERTDDKAGSSWIVDDNINYDSDSDEKHDEDKRSS